MGTNQNPLQRAEIFLTAVVCALLDSTFNALVGVTVHKKASFVFGFGNSMGFFQESMQEKLSNVANTEHLCYSLF